MMYIRGCGGWWKPFFERHMLGMGAANNVIMIAPYAKRGRGKCWDQTGYTGEKWYTKDGLQARALMNMLEYVTTTITK